MKRLFAVAIVAGMVFVSCGPKQEEPAVEPEQVEADAAVNPDVEEAEMPAEAEEAPAQQ